MADPTPEELAKFARESRSLQARFAEIMLRSPRLRWIAGPFRRLFKSIEQIADDERKRRGWK